MIGHRALAVACVVSVGMTLAGCGRGGRGRTGRAHVRVAVLPYLSHAPLFIAQDEGMFAAQGLDVELVQLPVNAVAVALARGEIDVASRYVSAGLFNMVARGADVRIVADKGSAAGTCSSDAYVGLRAEPGVATPRRGMRVAFDEGTVEEYWLTHWLASRGLTVSDVERRVVPDENEIEALRSGAIDVFHCSEPQLSTALESADVAVQAGIADVLPGMQFAVVLYGKRLLHERPEIGERFMVAFLGGVRRYGEGRTEANVATIARHTGLSAEVLRRACWPTVDPTGRINLESVMDFQRWAKERGYLDAVVPVERFWDPRFVEHAASRKTSGAL